MSDCAVEIKDLRITNTVAKGYAGGLIGYSESTGDPTQVGGGQIYASYAVGAIGAGNTVANIRYAGFVGWNHSTGIVKDCYSAVGVPATNDYNFCFNNAGTFTNCRYLNGSWTYGTNNAEYRALTDEGIPGVTATSYEDLQKFTSNAGTQPFIYNENASRILNYNIPAMATVTVTGYPFPVGTRQLVKDENENVKFDGVDNNKQLQKAALWRLLLRLRHRLAEGLEGLAPVRRRGTRARGTRPGGPTRA